MKRAKPLWYEGQTMQQESEKRQTEYWFPAKRYGWGWGLPCCWQGWVVFLGYLLGLAGAVLVLLWSRQILLFVALTALVTAALIAVCVVKGEPPRWRWGDD